MQAQVVARIRVEYLVAMDLNLTPPAGAMAQYGLSAAEFVERTAIATVWKVRRTTGDFAALKVYLLDDMGNERTGFAYLAAQDGRGAARIFGYGPNVAVLEWLPGPSLGDLSRIGKDEQATQALVAVANTLHASPVKKTDAFPVLETWFDALLTTPISPDCPDDARQDFLSCRALARDLLNSQRDVRALHGDLHHDNIRLGDRGYCAFDAKGVVGERTFELANAFRNPKGMGDLLADPDRIRFRLDIWSKAFQVDPIRLMQWAAVKCALSISWRADGLVTADREFDLLRVLLAIAIET